MAAEQHDPISFVREDLRELKGAIRALQESVNEVRTHMDDRITRAEHDSLEVKVNKQEKEMSFYKGVGASIYAAVGAAVGAGVSWITQR